ncbi:universal stress protein [Kribbella sindirgiensis]|uniref:Universal stress protein n=1 Tax=Kribbella sindirgiensis TaxID=1124744 RepID=A0A4R0HX57_9ACTN|nr:universal stress protein [Kribbella sindirgiensis]TCC16036.1 universal stress protein [Kribbella sindirgiensis]
MDKPVVIGYDGSPASAAAARWAASAAQRLGLRVRMIHAVHRPVVHSSGGAAAGLGMDVLVRPAEQLLDRACEELRAGYPGVLIDADVRIGEAVPILLRAATEASLLVLGSRGLGELRDRAEGSVMAHLATGASCPVVVVPEGWTAQPDRHAPVVVGIDGSELSRKAVAFAFAYAERTGASVTAVLAWRDSQSTGPGDMLFPVQDLEVVEEDGAAELGEAIAGQAVDHPDVQVTEKLVHGTASTVLVGESEGAELLVVGSRGRGPVRGLLLGSVSRAVLRHAACPVAVVR